MPRRPGPKPECGTLEGYQWHHGLGEEPDAACKKARNHWYNTARRQALARLRLERPDRFKSLLADEQRRAAKEITERTRSTASRRYSRARGRALERLRREHSSLFDRLFDEEFQLDRVRNKSAKCGTPSGYNRHLRLKEPACGACLRAKNGYDREYIATNDPTRARHRLYSSCRTKALEQLRREYPGTLAQLMAEEFPPGGAVRTRRREYNQARSRAMERLRQEHPDRFKQLLHEKLREHSERED